MTVKKLKELLAGFDDDLIVVVDDFTGHYGSALQSIELVIDSGLVVFKGAEDN